jgi:hypothetical protein
MDLEAAQKTIADFLDAFTLASEYFDAERQPILMMQYVAPNEQRDGMTIVFSVSAYADPEDPELRALAEKAMAALHVTHPELPPVTWDIEQS